MYTSPDSVAEETEARNRPRLNSATRQRNLLRFLAVIAGWALLGVGALIALWQIRGVLPPFFAAFVFAIALAPVVDRMEARGMSRRAATLLLYLFVFSLIGTLLFVLVPVVSEQIGDLVSELRVRFHLNQPSDITATVSEQIRIFGRVNNVPAFIIQPIVKQSKTWATSLTDALASFGSQLPAFIPNLIWVVLVPVIAFYALVDYHRIFAKLLLLFPRPRREGVRAIASDVTVVFGKYLRGLGIVCGLDIIATGAVLLCFPFMRPYAAALGLIAGILYAVPYLGAIVTTSLIALVAFVASGGSAAMMFYVTLSMVILNQVCFDQMLTPRVLGGQVGLHPILSIFALVSGNALFGVGGMLLAVPLAASVQVIVLHTVPRLARRIEVEPVDGLPAPLEEEAAEEAARPPVTVLSGEGVTTTPHQTLGRRNARRSGSGTPPPDSGRNEVV